MSNSAGVSEDPNTARKGAQYRPYQDQPVETSPVPFCSQVEQRYDGGYRQFWRFSSAILSNKFAELACRFAVKNC